MKKVLSTIVLAAGLLCISASAYAGPLTKKALSFVSTVEETTGLKIAILDRIEDPLAFWVRTAAILCQKTGDNFCEDNVRFMTANTEPSGQTQILQYTTKKGGPVKQVCALLPPVSNIDPSFVGEAFGTMFQNPNDYPSNDAMAAWLVLYHAAHCLDTIETRDPEARATAFATLALGLIEGGPGFTPGIQRVSARRIAVITKIDAAYWAAGTAERILLDYWKNEIAYILRSRYQCNVSVPTSTSIDIERIRRDSKLEKGADCSSTGGGVSNGGGSAANTTLTDANMWIWMYGKGGIGAPPSPYTAFAPLGNASAAARYILATSEKLAK